MNDSVQIHPTAVVAKDAVIGEGTVIHPFAVVASGVILGKNNVISKGASIHKQVCLGDNNFIGENAIIGIDPSNITFDRTLETSVKIGEGNIVKEFVTIERSTTPGQNTVIGNHNMFMVHTHIAHDCVIRDRVVIANYTALAGHVSVDSNTFISGGCFFHQFLRVGKGAMVGASSKVRGDVPPYVLVEGYVGRYHGLNVVGLRRAGFTTEERNLIKNIYQCLYRSTFSQGIEEISQMPAHPIRNEILDFLKNAKKRSIVRRYAKKDVDIEHEQ